MLFLETVALDRDRSGQDQQHANAGGGCGTPLLGLVNNGPTQKEPEAETDKYSAEYLAPFHESIPVPRLVPGIVAD
jgi:hypothetical protein